MRFYVILKRLLQRLPTAVVKEIGRQVVYSPIGAVDQIARKYVIDELERRRSRSICHWIERNMLNSNCENRDLNLTFSFEGLDERKFNDKHRTELQIPLVFAAASMMDFPEAAALLYKLKEGRFLPIDEFTDCFGNNPIWYLRCRKKQDSVPALLQRFRQCDLTRTSRTTWACR